MSRFVQYFWLYQNESRSCTRERALPSGDTQLIFDLSGHGLCVPDHFAASRSRDAVWGLYNGADSTYSSFEADHRPHYEIGVQFTPGGAHPFFAPPAGELENAHLSLEALWGVQAQELWERLMDAQTMEARCHLLEQALLVHAVRPLARRPAVAFALREFRRTPRPYSIAHVTDQIALSHTRFIQVFRDEVGLSPKQFCRVRRFVCVLKRSHHVERVDWAQLALECGYYDQAHLTHEFQRFAGVSPSAFVRDRDPRFPARLTLPNG